MALGTLTFYFAAAALTSSYKSLLIVLVFTLLLVAYIKLIEEKEMSLRFGDEYSRYKQTTPFLIPRLRAVKARPKA